MIAPPVISDAALMAFRRNLGCQPEGGHCDVGCNDCLRNAIAGTLAAITAEGGLTPAVVLLPNPPIEKLGDERPLFRRGDVVLFGAAIAVTLMAFVVLAKACA